MQASVNMWEGGLRASGGALVPSKSHWYLIKFLWDAQGRMRYATIKDTPATLSVRGPDNTVQPLERLDPHEARRTLGVRLAVDGNNKAEMEHRRQEALNWADALRTGRLPRPLAWLHMTTSIYKSLEYPLPATTFTQADCEFILRPVLCAGLPSSGISRNFPRALVHAPRRYQGLGLPNLWISQGVSHLLHALRHGSHSSITGQLLRTSLESLILDLGLPGCPFLSPIGKCKAYLT